VHGPHAPIALDAAELGRTTFEARPVCASSHAVEAAIAADC